MRKWLTAATLTLLMLLASCGAQPAAVPEASGDPTAAPDAAPTPPPDSTPPPSPAAPGADYPAPGADYPAPTTPQPDMTDSDKAQAEIERQARERLAQRLGVEPSALTLQSTAPQEWSDSSLGCPDPATTYMQVIMPGFLLEFSDGQKNYPVHTTLSALPGEPMVFCDGGSPVDLSAPAVAPSLDAAGQAMVELARQDLARQLEIDPEDIEVRQAQAVEWNDSSLGCPKPDSSYLQVITPGYRIELFAAEMLYTYHTDQQSTVVRCDQP